MCPQQFIIPRADSLPTEVARRLRTTISSGEFMPGDKLPSEQALSVAYGVSRPVIREALSLLKSDGLVVSQHGKGQFVNRDGASSFRIEPDFDDRESLARMFEFLLSVEVGATELAAERRTPEQLESIRKSLKALERAVKLSESGVQEDVDFHRAVIRASQNEYFIAFSDFLESRVRRLIRVARKNTAAQTTQMVAQVQKEHEAIFKAIEAQSVSNARKAAGAHLQNAAKRLRIYQGQ